jgi:FixJ family two-component response regulator
MAIRPIVSVVDDDESVRESLPDLLAELGFSARVFRSAEEFLDSGAISETRCLVLDIAMPGMSGPELYRGLCARGQGVPTVFISAHFNENVRADLIKQGAIACLFKPFTEKELETALRAAVGAS